MHPQVPRAWSHGLANVDPASVLGTSSSSPVISCFPSLPNPPLGSLPATPPLFPSPIIHLFWGRGGGSSPPPANRLINSHLCLSPTIQAFTTHAQTCTCTRVFNQIYCAAPFLAVVSSFFSSFKTFSGTHVRAYFYLCGDISFPSSLHHKLTP